MRPILVTGGSGFIGQHLVATLKRDGYPVEWVNSENYDLREYVQVEAMLSDIGPSVVFDMAAKVGGIGANRRSPATFWHENLAMGMNLLRACAETKARPEKIIFMGTTCSYPAEPKTIPFIEDELFDGYPEPTNAPYGIAKRALMAGIKAYRQQHGLKASIAIPTNTYGPGDSFSPGKSHVIPAIMRKIRMAGPEFSDHAKETGQPDDVLLWGSGKATRDFLYVDDLVQGLILMMQRYHEPEPVNFGSGREVQIRQLAFMIAEAAGYDGTLQFDVSKPDGQPRRAMDITRARACLKWEPKVDMAEGIIKTWDWFKSQDLIQIPPRDKR